MSCSGGIVRSAFFFKMKIKITFEQALAKASPRLRKQMEHTRDIILKAVPLALRYDPDKGFFVGFSGGKDSQALYHMMQLCDVPMHAYFSPTSIDPAENIRFIRKNYPEVEFTKLDKSIFDVFREMKVLPSMKIRWCCAYFKEKGGEGKVVCTGVRKAESVKRSKRNEIEVSGRKFSGHMDEFEQWQEKRIRRQLKNLNQDQYSESKQTEVRCINGKDKILLNPIIEWSEEDVWELLNKVVEVPHCELYDEGYTRIGCIGCPMATTKNQIKQFKRWPHVKEKWIRAIMDVRRESILANTPSQSGATYNFYSLNGLYLPQQESSIANSIKNWNGAIGISKTLPPISTIRKSIHENADCKDKILTERSATARQGIGEEFHYRGATTQRTLDGKFLDSGNGDCSAVVAEYDEQKEREIAEAIFDWWISKKSFKQWFTEKYQQGRLDFDEDNEQ